MYLVLSTIGLLIAKLNKMADVGNELYGLNIVIWFRRWHYKKHSNANPIFSITDPKEVAGLLVVAVAKIDGDMCLEEKRQVQKICEQILHLTKREAASLIVSSVYMLRDCHDVRLNLSGVLRPSRQNFSQEQIESVLLLVECVANIGGSASQLQRELIENIHRELIKSISWMDNRQLNLDI